MPIVSMGTAPGRKWIHGAVGDIKHAWNAQEMSTNTHQGQSAAAQNAEFLSASQPLTTLCILDGTIPATGILTKLHTDWTAKDKALLCYYLAITMVRAIVSIQQLVHYFTTMNDDKMEYIYVKVLKGVIGAYIFLQIPCSLLANFKLRTFVMQRSVKPAAAASKRSFWVARLVAATITIYLIARMSLAIRDARKINAKCPTWQSSSMWASVTCNFSGIHHFLTERYLAFPDLSIPLGVFLAYELKCIANVPESNTYCHQSSASAVDDHNKHVHSIDSLLEKWLELHYTARALGGIIAPTGLLILSTSVIYVTFVLKFLVATPMGGIEMQRFFALASVNGALVIGAMAIVGQKITNESERFVATLCQAASNGVGYSASGQVQGASRNKIQDFIAIASALGPTKVEMGGLCTLNHSLVTTVISTVMTYYIVLAQTGTN